MKKTRANESIVVMILVSSSIPLHIRIRIRIRIRDWTYESMSQPMKELSDGLWELIHGTPLRRAGRPVQWPVGLFHRRTGCWSSRAFLGAQWLQQFTVHHATPFRSSVGAFHALLPLMLRKDHFWVSEMKNTAMAQRLRAGACFHRKMTSQGTQKHHQNQQGSLWGSGNCICLPFGTHVHHLNIF